MPNVLWIVTIFALSLSMLSSRDALAQTPSSAQKAVDDAISAAERVCIVGNRFKFEAELSGGILIKKMIPAGQGRATYDAIRTTGSVDFKNEEVRRFVDGDIRECMAKQWIRVHEVLVANGVSASQRTARSDVVRVRIIENLEISLENASSGNNGTDFAVVVSNRSDKAARLLLHARHQVGPMFIDESGRAKSTENVMGVPSCKWDVNACFKEVPIETWAVINRGHQLPLSLSFSWATVKAGSLVTLSFTLLQAIEGTNGRYSFSSIPVSFLRVPVGN